MDKSYFSAASGAVGANQLRSSANNRSPGKRAVGASRPGVLTPPSKPKLRWSDIMPATFYFAPTALFVLGALSVPGLLAPKGAFARGYDCLAATRRTGAYGAAADVTLRRLEWWLLDKSRAPEQKFLPTVPEPQQSWGSRRHAANRRLRRFPNPGACCASAAEKTSVRLLQKSSGGGK